MSALIECKSCKNQVSSEAKSCPQCGAPVKKKMGLIKKIGVGFLVLFVISAFANSGGNGSAGSSTSSKSAEGSGAASVASMPESQKLFLSIVSKARKEAGGARNDMARGGILAERSNSLKRMDLDVDGWTGKVADIDSNSDGKGVLSIEIAPDVYVKTWNNSLSDISSKTLLEPSGAVFKAAANMRKGQRVKFSGSFFRDDEIGLQEQSLSLQGKLREPEFVFKFRSIESQ